MTTPPKLAIQRSSSGKYILRYDASLIGESNCLWRVWLKLFRGLKGEGEGDFKMNYGTGFHKAMVEWYGGKGIEVATRAAFDYYSQITVPESDWRDVTHLINCVMQYVYWYKKEGDLLRPDTDTDGKPLLEKPFAYPFYSTPLTDVLLCGTMDFIGKFANITPVIVDHKTTALTQVNSYLAGYDLSSQLMTYTMIWRKLFPDRPVPASMINGVFLSKTNQNKFARTTPIYFNDYQLAMHERRVTALIKNVVAQFEAWLMEVVRGRDANAVLDEGFTPNYTCCKKEYGMCEYSPVCKTESRDSQEGIIGNHYKMETYDPLKFQN